MQSMPMMAQTSSANSGLYIIIVFAVIVFVLLYVSFFLASRYKKSSEKNILVIWGASTQSEGFECIHGGGRFVWPIIEDYAYLSLEHIVVKFPLDGAQTQDRVPVKMELTFTLRVSTDPEQMKIAAERLLGMSEEEINMLAEDILHVQIREIVAKMPIDEARKNRPHLIDLIDSRSKEELAKVGLTIVNKRIGDLIVDPT